MTFRIAGLVAGSAVVAVGLGLLGTSPAHAEGQSSPLSAVGQQSSTQAAPGPGYTMAPSGSAAGGTAGTGPAVGIGPGTGTGTSERPSLDGKTSKFDEMERALAEQIAKYDAAAKAHIASGL